MEKEIEFEASLYFFRAVKVSDEQVTERHERLGQ
jgi:hypothetical protein